MKLRHELALVLLLVLLAAPTRLLGLETLPPGLFHDEAYEGIDAWRILAGARPVFLPENYGREPLYAYVMAGLFQVAGPTVVGVRATSALFGLLLIPAAHLWARALFGPATGLVVAALTTGSYWVLHESRVGMRPIALPLFLALASACTWLAARHGRRWAWPAAGLALGLGLYTYLPARLFPLVVVAQGLLGIAAAPPAAGRWRRGGLGLAVLLVVAGLVVLPLGLYFRANPDDASARSNVVSIFADEQARAHPAGALLENAGRNLGMFVWRGDDTARHNLPERPVFDPLIGLCAALGVVLSLRRLRRGELAEAAVWIWLAVMSLPGLLSDSAPHFLRSIGLLPALFALPARGLLAGAGALAARGGRPAVAAPLAALALAGSLGLTLFDYLARLPAVAELPVLFDAPRAALARVAGDPPSGTDLDLPTPGWSYATIRFLRPRSFTPPSLPPERGAQARFGANVVLLGAVPGPDGPGSLPGQRLTLYWRALREMNASYVETARIVDGYGRVWWQRDGVPGRGTLPTDTWLPSEIVADHLQVELIEGTPPGDYLLEIALAQPDGGRRLPVVDAGGRAAGSSARLGVSIREGRIR